jgi:hypothetical protein
MRSITIAFLLCVLAAFCSAEDVTVLSHSNWADIVDKKDFALVEFYAPWV